MIRRTLFLTLLLLSLCLKGLATITLPRLISDGMVLQRNAEVKVWGWASPSELIKIRFLDKTYSIKANEQGSWQVKLTPMTAGGPYTMLLEGTNTIEIKDIRIGDVWICSGQSNMELSMSRVSPLYPNEIASANNPAIRYFEGTKTFDFKKEREDFTSGQWDAVNQSNISRFSATAYFFASALYRQYKVPIGLINISLGGSPAEAWVDETTLKDFPHYYKELQSFKSDSLIEAIRKGDQQRMNSWYSQVNENDMGIKSTPSWKSPEASVDSWKSMTIPGFWSESEGKTVNGVVWFRKEVSLSNAEAGKPAKLELGRIVDADSVFVNGTYIGRTTYQYPPRRYTIPEGVLKAGKNTISVKVINERGSGGFVPDKDYVLKTDKKSYDLRGTWLYKVGNTMPPLQGQTFIRWKPGGLFNAMVAPALNYSIKGAIWYQGESNTSRAQEYSSLFKSLIRNWRSRWGQGDFPFIFVQLTNFMEVKSSPQESQWAELRDAQASALELPNTGMAVTIDIGEWNDIHPLNKKDVGERLALEARKVAYGEKDLVSRGPEVASFKLEGSKVVLTFRDAENGLIAKGNKGLHHFALADANGQFQWAKAKIQGSQIIVWSDSIKQPTQLRYAWADNPDTANLCNKQGLPAGPFQIDLR